MSPDQRVILNPKQKALNINLDTGIYGVFSEVGAGQEVVRHFFRAGGASGTIAMALSAYDKDFSDDLYGNQDGRYVCKPRLQTMLDHEYDLIEERLTNEAKINTCHFVYANTVATIDYRKTSKGHGWMGIKFQLRENSAPNTILMHFRLHDLEQSMQQEAIGVVGVNLVYGAFRHPDDPKLLLRSLYDEMDRDRVEIDMIHFEGPDFEHVDNRLLSLQLVGNGMTDAVIFGPDGNNIHPTELLYKKHILTLRGSFRPVTKVNIDMIQNGYKEFVKDPKVDRENMVELFEITMNNLTAEGDLDEQDFLDRAELLCALGQTVLISNFQQHFKLVDYISLYTRKRSGLIIGVDNLLNMFDEKYYRELNGQILEAFGIILSRDLRIFLYPTHDPVTGEMYNSKNLPVPKRVRPLYEYMMYNGRILDLEDYNPNVLDIFSKDVLKKIRRGQSGWEDEVPSYVDNIIKEHGLFGWKKEATKAEKKETAE